MIQMTVTAPSYCPDFPGSTGDIRFPSPCLAKGTPCLELCLTDDPHLNLGLVGDLSLPHVYH